MREGVLAPPWSKKNGIGVRFYTAFADKGEDSNPLKLYYEYVDANVGMYTGKRAGNP